MKAYFLNSSIISLILIAFCSCTSIDIEQDKEIIEHLKAYTFEYVDYKNNMTSFVQFEDSKCELSVNLTGELATSKAYNYSLGGIKYDKRVIDIEGNTGQWNIKKDGQLYMYNENELFIYHTITLDN